MDRRKLLSLFNLRLGSREAGQPSAAGLRPDAVYQAAQAIRSRIDAALAASRRDTTPQ